MVSRASSSDAYEEDTISSQDEVDCGDQKIDEIVQSVSSNSSTEDSSGKNATYANVKGGGLKVDTTALKEDDDFKHANTDSQVIQDMTPESFVNSPDRTPAMRKIKFAFQDFGKD